ncbi:PIN domain-like protein [Irpex lacteus]|nr:PIN domain-like protein [Irpex lacteus]
MGIKGLTACSPSTHQKLFKYEHDIKTLFGRKVAIDAQKDGELLTNDAGDNKVYYSHLMGFFYRTIRMVENGIKPMYVFDGKPPEMKSLSKRKEEGEEAKETGRRRHGQFSRRTVKVTKEHNEECDAFSDSWDSFSEAQCAELARGGKVYAAGSEDMDTLTFHAPFSTDILLSPRLFIDLCILLGCDYSSPSKVWPQVRLKLIREYGGLNEVIEHLREKRNQEEEEGDFEKPDVKPASEVEVEWKSPDVEGLVDFLVKEKGFNEERVRKGAEKLSKFLNAKQQGRLTVLHRPAENVAKERQGRGKGKGKGTKRKADTKTTKASSSKKAKK